MINMQIPESIYNIIQRINLGEENWMIVAGVCLLLALLGLTGNIVITRRARKRERDREIDLICRNEKVMRLVAGHSDRAVFSYDIASRKAFPLRGEDSGIFMQEMLHNLPELAINSGHIMDESVEDIRRLFADIHSGVPSGGCKLHLRKVDDQRRWYDVKFTTVADDENVAHAVVSVLDITDEYMRQLAYQRFRQAVDEPNEGGFTFIIDITADVVERQYGLASDFSGKNYTQVLNDNYGGIIFIEDGEWGSEYFSREHLMMLYSIDVRHVEDDWLIREEDSKCWKHVNLDLVEDPYSGHLKAFVKVSDITKEKEQSIEQQRVSRLDGLTGLYSRAVGEKIIRDFLAGDSGQRCALLVMDLDNLKSINDNLGHMEGDRAIKQIADAMRSQFRVTDTIARLGGDEFIALLPFVSDNAHLGSTMLSLMQAIAAIRVGEDNDVRVSCSIGGAFGKVGMDSFETLYDKADRALYHVKRGGKNNYAFYSDEMVSEDYHYKPNPGLMLDYSNLPVEDVKRLISALSYVYPVMMFCNYTKNTYRAIQFAYDEESWFRAVGQPDELLEEIIRSLHPDDRDGFAAVFCRDNIIALHAEGVPRILYSARHMTGDGVYRMMRVHFVFSKNQDTGDDITGVMFARVNDIEHVEKNTAEVKKA